MKEAIELAESYVTYNTYSLQLETKAYGIHKGRKGGAPGWTVVFKYNVCQGCKEKDVGRAVTFNLDGSDIRVEHVDFILNKVDIKL